MFFIVLFRIERETGKELSSQSFPYKRMQKKEASGFKRGPFDTHRGILANKPDESIDMHDTHHIGAYTPTSLADTLQYECALINYEKQSGLNRYR